MQPQNKPQKRKINGVLLLDKAIGISSNTALQQVRRLYRAEKAGHTGVLDPLASGLLPICFGEAAKFAQYLLDADKSYIATLKLGEASSTGDAEGEIIARGNHQFTSEAFSAACLKLTGKIRQVPPMFSALKHEGKPLYEYARKGITIERKARDIEIYRIKVIEFASPFATIDVSCSKGTYIRTLSEDIAKELGTYAHLTALRRTATAGFKLSQSHCFEHLQQLEENERDHLLLPCDVLVQHLPQHTLGSNFVRQLQYGQRVFTTEKLPENTPIRIYSENNTFIGLVQFLPKTQELKALRLMNPDVSPSS